MYVINFVKERLEQSKNENWWNREVRVSKLGIIGNFDNFVLKRVRGWRFFYWKVSYESGFLRNQMKKKDFEENLREDWNGYRETSERLNGLCRERKRWIGF